MRILFCFSFLLICLNGNCQQPTLKFIHYTTKDGLPSSQIYQTFQDSKGYLWFTSDHGLIQYNGYEFKTYSTEDGLTDNTVFKIVEDHHGRLWLLTFSGGIAVYENKKIHPYKYNALVKEQLKGSIPLGIYVDSIDNVFVTGHQIGEFKIDSTGHVSQQYNFIHDNGKHKIFIDEHSKKYLLTSIYSYDDSERPLILYYRTGNISDSVVIPSVKQRKVHAVRLNDNRILIAIANRIFEYKKGSITELVVLKDDAVHLFEDSKKRLWVGTNNGIYIFNNSHNLKNYTTYLTGYFVASVFEDIEGSFWITTIDNGLYYLGNDQIKNFVFDNHNLDEPLIITSDKKSSVYAGYWSGAVAKFENQNLVNVNTSFYRDIITCLYFDSTSTRLLIGSRSTGYLLKNIYYPFNKMDIPSMPLDFIKSKSGVIYGVGDRVIYRIKGDSIVQIGLFTIRINCIYEMGQGEFLLGCNNGAYVFNEHDGKLKLYCTQLKDVRIDDIKKFNQYCCFATRGKGLLLLQHATFRWIKHSDGLASNLIHKLAIDGNDIWCATNNGISRLSFSDNSEFEYKISNVNARDGLPSNEVHDLAILNDTLFAATSDGISVFSTRLNFFNAAAPPIYFTSMRINSTDTIIAGYYKLPHQFNNIFIGFEALSFKSAGDIQYRYVLTDQHDSIVNITKNREAEFLSLNPGNYVFRVTAINSSGTHSAKPLTFHFVIQKPFWLEWWFRIMVVFVIAIIVFLFVNRHIQRIRKEEEIKTAFNKQLVQFEIKALRAQMNPHFIFNVLNSIQDYILKNDAKSAQKYLTKFARLVRLILDNSVKAEVALAEELKAAQLYVELEQQRFENKFEFIMHIDDMVDTEQIIIPAMIIQPYLENAIKHGIRHLSVQGKLILSVVKKDHQIIISIEDNGVGRAASAESNKTNVMDHVSHGTIITAKRMDAYNRAFKSDISAIVHDLKDENGVATGTRIEVYAPIKYQTFNAE